MDPEDDAHIPARYVNYFRSGCNRYEFILDFGQSIESHNSFLWRVICCPPYAQELCTVLHASLEQYRKEYGPIAKLRSED